MADYLICAGPKNGNRDTCQGDSGGPLMVRDFKSRRYILIGLNSYGHGCAVKDAPGMYARVTYFLNWVYENTADGCYCHNPTP